MNKLFKCIDSYQKLCSMIYEIEVYTGKELQSISIQFNPSNFLHLAGLTKIDNNPIIDKYRDNSTEFLDYFLNNSSDPRVMSEAKEISALSYSYQTNKRYNKLKNFYVSDRIEELSIAIHKISLTP